MDFSDVRYTIRMWRRRPSFVAVASLSIGLGVAATTTMYSLVNRVAHYELGFADVNRLAVLWSTDTARGINEQPPNVRDRAGPHDAGTAFESFGFFQGNGAPVTLTGPSGASRVEQMPVDVNALSIVGIKPLLGRTYRTGRLRRRGQAEGSARDRRQLRHVAAPVGRISGRDRHDRPRGR